MSTLSRTRPGQNSRWVDSQAWVIKPTLDEAESGWLGQEWMEEMMKKKGTVYDPYDGSNFRYPSVNEIQVGI